MSSSEGGSQINRPFKGGFEAISGFFMAIYYPWWLALVFVQLINAHMHIIKIIHGCTVTVKFRQLHDDLLSRANSRELTKRNSLNTISRTEANLHNHRCYSCSVHHTCIIWELCRHAQLVFELMTYDTIASTIEWHTLTISATSAGSWYILISNRIWNVF